MSATHSDGERVLRNCLVQIAQLMAGSRNGWRYPSIEALVLANGCFTAPAAARAVSRGQPRQCFRNAFETACAGGLTYVEGYALPFATCPLPLLHAWCIDVDGSLVEPTWQDPGAAYLGIHFALSFVLDTISQRNRYGVLDAYDLRWPLLQHGLPAGSVSNCLVVCSQTAGVVAHAR